MSNKSVMAIRSNSEVVTLSTGVKVKFHPVGSGVIESVANSIPAPEIPVWHNDEYNRDEENPLDPEYRKLLMEFEQKRGKVTVDTLMLLGVELVDGMPDDTWVENIRKVEKRTGVKFFDGYDLDDPDEKELAYKRIIAFSPQDYGTLYQNTGITAEEVEKATESFRGN